MRRPRLVFISHAGPDTWVARQLAREIAACGASPFLDEADIAIGDLYADKIFGYLNPADEFVVLLTPWALKRGWILLEIGAARSRGIPIIAVLHGVGVEDVQAQDHFQVIAERNIVALNNIDRYLEELRLRVEGAK